jgi:hypothetical protein
VATEAQLIEGIKRADKAGDAASVKALGAALVAMRQPKAAPKDDSALNAFVLGARKPLDNASRWAGQGIGGDMGKKAVAVSDEADQLRHNNTRTGWQTIGNIVGTGIAQFATRGKGGAFAQGAGAGALLSDADTPEGVAMDAGIGGIGGKAGEMLANGLSYLAKPVVSKGSKLLYEAGIPQTIGQIASQGKGLGSKIIAGAEEKLTSVPILGDVINSARDRGTEAFNVALANRVLANIGEKLPKGTEAGSEMIEAVNERLKSKYGALVPKLIGNFDGQFAADLGKAKALTATLPAARQKQFGTIVYDVLGNRAKGAQISGQALKDAESRLTTLTKQYRNSTDADQRIMADAIDKVRASLRSMVARNNPAHADELQALNKGWAQLGQLRKASTSAGNATGVVTPAQALSAARRSGFENDDLVKTAKGILPNRTPDSGTATRAGYGMLATGAGGALVSPYLAVPAAASVLYTKPGMKALNSLVFAPRSKVLKSSATALRAFGQVAPAVIPATLKQDR